MIQSSITIAEAPSFWGHALSSDLSIGCAAIIIVCGLLLGVGWRVLRRTRRRPVGNPITESRGTATIEFALVFPILLFLMLLLAQTTMLMAGNLFVHYSAFAATRSAIVQIPRDVPGCPPNCYINSMSNDKHEAIWRAAVYAVAPAGSRQGGSGSGVNPGAYTEGLSQFFEGFGRETPGWVEGIAGDRLAYAADHTQLTVMHVEVEQDDTVTFHGIESGQSYQFDTHEPVAVRVEHRLALGVPYINRVYSDGHTDAGEYVLVSARYMLTNEGMRDELPPKPNIPRRTP